MLGLILIFLTGILLPPAIEVYGGWEGGYGNPVQGMSSGCFSTGKPGYRGCCSPKMSNPPCRGYGEPTGKSGAGYSEGRCPWLAYYQGRNKPLNPQPDQALNRTIEKEAGDKAIKLYQDTYGKKDGLTAKVTNYGCHTQVDVYEKDKLVKSYIYQQGNLFEM